MDCDRRLSSLYSRKYIIPGDSSEVMEQRLKSSIASIKTRIPSEENDSLEKDERDLNNVCFRESLDILSEDGNGPGKFVVSIEKESDGPEVVYQVYTSINHSFDGIKQESTILGRVTPAFATLEEMRIDTLQLGNKKIEHHVYILNEGDNYHISVSSFDGDKWEKTEAGVPVENKTILMGEAANYLLLRASAIEGEMKVKNYTTILNDGSLHSCRYDFRQSIGRFGRNKEEIKSISAKKTVNSPGGVHIFKWILSFGGGYILEEKIMFPPGSLLYPLVECGIGATISDTEEDSITTTPEESVSLTERVTISSDKLGKEVSMELGQTSEDVRPLGEYEEPREPRELTERGPEETEEGGEVRKESTSEEGVGYKERPSTVEGEEAETEVAFVRDGEGKIDDRKDTAEEFGQDEVKKLETAAEDKGEEEREDHGIEEEEERKSSKVVDEETAESLSTVLEESDENSVQEEEDKTDLEEIDEDDEEGEAVDEEEAAEDAGEGSSGEDKIEDKEEEEEEGEGASLGEGSEVEGEGSESGSGGSSEEGSRESETTSAAKEEVHRVFSFEQEGYFPLDLTSEESEGGVKLEEILRDIRVVKRDCKELRKDIRQERRQEEEWRRALRGSMLGAAGPLRWRLLEGSRRIRISRYALVFPDGRVDQGPIPLEYRWREDPQLLSAYKSCKIKRRMDIRSYSDDQKELADLLSDFLMHVLMDKPEDVIKYSKEYFAAFK